MTAMRIVKFLISGAAGVSVNLAVFHALYTASVPYLVGSAAGVLTSLAVSFLLQKYWTFADRTSGQVHTQFMLYVALGLCNLALNIGIVYVLIGKLGVFYLLAQAISAALIALNSFFMYHAFIFKRHEGSGVPIEL